MVRSSRHEPEGDWRGFDAYDVIDSPSASFELERLFDLASGGCPEVVGDLTALLDAAHDDLAAGRADSGIAGLREFSERVEGLREEGRLPVRFAGDLLALAEAAIVWAADRDGDAD